MSLIHHSAICVRDMDAALRFWCEGLGFQQIMDHSFDGDWPTLLRAPSTRLRALFLGDPAHPEAGIVELVDLGDVQEGGQSHDDVRSGFLLLSIMTDVDIVLARLDSLGLGGVPRRVTVSGVDMAVVIDPSGVQVELVGSTASRNLQELNQHVEEN